MPTLAQNVKNEKRGAKCKKSGTKYSAIHFLFFVVCDKCLAGVEKFHFKNYRLLSIGKTIDIQHLNYEWWLPMWMSNVLPFYGIVQCYGQMLCIAVTLHSNFVHCNFVANSTCYKSPLHEDVTLQVCNHLKEWRNGGGRKGVYLQMFPLVPMQVGEGAVSVGPIRHACIIICPVFIKYEVCNYLKEWRNVGRKVTYLKVFLLVPMQAREAILGQGCSVCGTNLACVHPSSLNTIFTENFYKISSFFDAFSKFIWIIPKFTEFLFQFPQIFIKLISALLRCRHFCKICAAFLSQFD